MTEVAVGTGVTLIASANAKRKSILITGITGTNLTYIGFSNGVSSGTGQLLPASVGASLTIESQNAIWGIAITAAQTVSVLEEEYVT